MQRIQAQVLIPGSGEPVEDASVLLDGARIAYAGPSSGAPRASEVTATYEVPVVMPGMWDTHAHFLGVTGLNLEDLVRIPPQVSSARAVKDAEAALMAGFTSIREAGGLGVHLARVIDEGTIRGPSVYAPGAIISQTGGHADLHAYPLAWMHGYAESGGFMHLADGVPECLKVVRAQLRLGAKVIKVCASGGVLSELDDPIHQQFSDEELRAIVGEANRAGRIVMAHCHGQPGIMAALKAGCHTIEHGSYLDEAAADMMLERSAILVPTRFVIERLVGAAKDSGLPDYAYRKAVDIADRHLEAMRLAVAKGVRIALGTDIATSGADSGVPWGMHGGEFPHLVEAGMTPLQAIESATANGPLTLGPEQAPPSGRLQEGLDADVIALARNPLDDVGILSHAANVTMVWKKGELVKTRPINPRLN